MLQRKRRAIIGMVAMLVVLMLVPLQLSAVEAQDASAAETTEISVDDAVEIAIEYAQERASTLGVTSSDVEDLTVTSAYRSGHNGVTHVNLNQRYEGLEVFSGHATISVKDEAVVFAAGTFVADLAAGASGETDLDVIEAVEAAAEGLDLDEPEGLRLLRKQGGTARESVVSDGGISEAPIPVRLGWQPTEDGLRLAWQLEIDDASDVHYWNATVDAATGELLDVDDWTIEDEYEDLASTVHGGKLPSAQTSSVPARGFSLNPVIDGSCYRVFDLALESPNDGDRRLVCNPADATASPFGWHDTDGTPGPEFTITRGNNVHAYLDQDSGQGAGFSNTPDLGFDVDGGPNLQFDFPLDLTEHAQAYREAVVTNLFFGCNTFHDLLYLYGMTEEAGALQANNYGRDPNGVGGPEGDYARCEAADGSGTNNANWNDGAARMQMFLWPGNQFGSQNQVVVDGVGDFGGSWARFAEAPSNAGTSGAIVEGGNGCAAAQYPAEPPAGAWIALVTTGTCNNVVKGQVAQAQGASALIVSGGAAAGILTGPITLPRVTIPVMSLSAADGNTIRDALPATGTVRKSPTHPGIRDGDLENGIIFHEYGHGMSIRLTGGPTVSCLGSGGNQQQAGEGWSDYVANVSMIDLQLDDPEGARGMGPYALFQDSRQGAGIRHRPYSRNMEVQPATYDSIKTGGWLNGTSVSSPHGIGHVFAAMLWDMTWDLIDKHGFSGNIYLPWNAGGNNRAMQYMVDGLKLQGCGPTFVVASRAIIEAANVLGGGSTGDVAGDACTLWASFSRRGLGFSATSPTGNRDAGSEAFDTHPACRRGFEAPVHQPYGSLNVVGAGDNVPLRFTADGASGVDILATNSPFSRKVDCGTFQVPSVDPEFITPREQPVLTSPPGKTGLSVNNAGVYRYNWKTSTEWAGTCREVVLTRTDGKQHRAFFQFT